MCSTEGGGALPHKHFQMVVKENFNIPPTLNKKIKVCLKWHEDPPTGHVVSCKKLRNKGLQTFFGMVGYCTKEDGEEHFYCWHFPFIYCCPCY